MADSNYYNDGPFKRKQWNMLISDINGLLATPPSDTDCKPIAPLELVKPEHIWTKKDVETVREKLQETCSTITFSEELKIWREKIIDEIEEQMKNMWCDCEEEEKCTYQCPNAGSDSVSMLGAMYSICIQDDSATADPCGDHMGDERTEGCTLFPFEGRRWPSGAYEQAKAARDAFGRASKASYKAISLRVDALAHGSAAQDYQDVADDLTDQIAQLAQAKALACADESNEYFCTVATERLEKAQKDLETANDNKSREDAAYSKGLAEADKKATESENECTSGNTLMSGYMAMFPSPEDKLMFLWSSKSGLSCDSYTSIYTVENLRAGKLADNCWPTWSIQVVGDGTEENPDTTTNSGAFTPGGNPIGLGVGGYGWYGILHIEYPAGRCPIGYFPFWLETKKREACVICTGGTAGCRGRCEIDGCTPGDLAALYTEYKAVIRMPAPRGEKCPEPVPEVQYDANGDPIPPEPTPGG